MTRFSDRRMHRQVLSDVPVAQPQAPKINSSDSATRITLFEVRSKLKLLEVQAERRVEEGVSNRPAKGLRKGIRRLKAEERSILEGTNQ
ncbi:MAG: hypothetical protein Q8P68_00480 [Candidatus Peregrinibacteria bacterium]|nr:hypothetical protein [Candidatus Peregrinibacteria bacterium]MDZ4245178.1 hypothetical protein [Candidatus Gracilibacteria bacterium]